MRVFVTGWGGLLGSALVPLLRATHEVEGMGTADGDIADPRLVRSRLDAFRPDTVVHLAAMTAVDACEEHEAEAFRVNAEGSRLVAAESERLGARVLAVSSDYVFDGTKGAPYTEDDPVHPLNVYGRSKRAGEEGVMAASTRWTVVRSAWLYGPGGRNFVNTILGLLESRESVPVVADQTGSPTYAPDLARGIADLVARRAEGLYHVVNAGRASWFDLAREAARRAGVDPDRVRPANTAEVGRPAPRPRFSVLDASRVRERHGVDLRPWTEALAEYLGGRKRSPAGT